MPQRFDRIEACRPLAAEYGVSRNMIERDMMRAMDRVQTAMERWHTGVAVPSAPHDTSLVPSLLKPTL